MKEIALVLPLPYKACIPLYIYQAVLLFFGGGEKKGAALLYRSHIRNCCTFSFGVFEQGLRFSEKLKEILTLLLYLVPNKIFHQKAIFACA